MRRGVVGAVVAGALATGVAGAPASADEPVVPGGSAIAFGSSGSGQTEVPDLPPGATYTALAAGENHTVLLRSDGQVLAFGSSGSGQTEVPDLPPGVTYTDVAGGTDHTVLLRSDGEAVAFGSNSYGQTEVPELPEGVVYTDAAAGWGQTLLLRSDGNVEAFGHSAAGKTEVPDLPPGVTYTSVAAGVNHTVLLRSDGEAVAFGEDRHGQTEVPELPEGVVYTAATAGGWHSVLLRSDGNVEAFGASTQGRTDVPDLPPGTTYTDVAGGGLHTVLLRSDGEAVAFGSDNFGRTDVPELPEGMVYTDVAAGYGHTVLLRSAVDTEVSLEAPDSIAATDAEVEVSASVDAAGEDQPGVAFSGTVRFTIDGQDPIDVNVNDEGEATTTVDGLPTTAGSTIAVSATYLGSTDGAYLASAVPADHDIEITAGPVDAIEVSPSAEQIVAGESVTYTVNGTDRFGNDLGDLTDTTTIAPGTNTGAEVDGNTVTFTTVGAHTITATVDSDPEIATTATVDVTAAPLAAIDLRAPDGLEIREGGSLTFAVDGTDAYGNRVDIENDAVTLTSDQSSDIVDGLTVTFPEASPHRITATVGNLTDTVTVEVTPSTPAPANPEPSAPELPETGAGVGTPLTGAALLLLLGAALTMAAHRTARPQHT
ncbi:RCC1 domain-containing protein [Ruania rhizosphaerae]|uniref:RCC1 domain-containing protein n=1 Tax=Ruania rhizosphaerae TaxID=1840413 RepID=UPI001F2B204E|nr:hypothetical protein [Ruania rhizosphaerae]